MFHRVQTLSISEEDLEDYLYDDLLTGVEDVAIISETNNCTLSIYYLKKLSLDTIKENFESDFGEDVDIEKYTKDSNKKRIKINLPLSIFKRAMEKDLNVKLSDTCLIDDEKELIYFILE